MSKPVLLAVDDDNEVLRAVDRDLKQKYAADYRVLRAESGQVALDTFKQLKLRNETVALMLVDQRMPQKTGVAFLKETLELYPKSKRVLLTAYADTEAAIQAINGAKIDYYLTKPWTPPHESLYPILDDLLEDWRSDYRPAFEGVRVVGHRWSPESHAIKDFMARNRVPYQWVDVEAKERDEATKQLLDALGDAECLPMVLFPDGTRLTQPTITEVAEKLGLQVRAEDTFYDLVILQDLDAQTQQQEKMDALGKLAAGLAHELNNPAAANCRAAEQMREALKRQKSLALRLNLGCLMAEQHARLTDFLSHITDSDQVVLDPLTRSDREDVLSEWLDAKQIPDSWRAAATFVSAGLEVAQLDTLADDLPEPMLADVLAWIEASLAVRELLDSIEKSATRMSEIVKAVKEYTSMDEVALQEMDLHEGIENTLTILAYKLRQTDVNLVRGFDAAIPTICAYGSELNQVWTNLLDNAIDALTDIPAPRTLTIRTRPAGEDVLVEILDNGPGIAPEIKNRIFDPFFTTKDVGKGTGLGLDIAYRIVVRRHHGEISVESQPGETRFIVRLPLAPPRQRSQGEK